MVSQGYLERMRICMSTHAPLLNDHTPGLGVAVSVHMESENGLLLHRTADKDGNLSENANACNTMAFNGFYESAAWGESEPETQDIVKDAIRKEQVLQEITAAQDDLRALLTRVHSVQADVDKLTSENATLQVYIDNLTMQMAKRK